MDDRSKASRSRREENYDLLVLAVVTLVAGAAAGCLTAVFRITLERADDYRASLIEWSHGHGVWGFARIVLGAAAAAALACWLVRRFSPHAKGSGIPHVEAVLKGEHPPAPLSLIPVKFFGGVLSMGTGLALGREGPSVQMGASLSHVVGRLFRRNEQDALALLAAGAGAGLATAFNAPVAGSVFVLEEIVRRFDLRNTITTLGASTAAIIVSRALLGRAPNFAVEAIPFPGSESVPLFLVLGLICGLVGTAYNHAILGALAGQELLKSVPAELRAAIVGALVGIIGWFGPTLIGGGDALTQQALAGPEPLLPLILVVVLRFGLGAVSYSAGTPGGLFAPMLVVGAQTGLIVGIVFAQWFPGLAIHPAAFAVVGMAAFFTAVVRAPVTGIVLITEMTATFTLLLPLLGACFVAMIVPTMLRTEPIYDSLSEPPVLPPAEVDVPK